MSAIVLTQFFVLAALVLILAMLYVLALLEAPAARSTEKFLSGIAYGLTAAVVFATLVFIINPN